MKFSWVHIFLGVYRMEFSLCCRFYSHCIGHQTTLCSIWSQDSACFTSSIIHPSLTVHNFTDSVAMWWPLYSYVQFTVHRLVVWVLDSQCDGGKYRAPSLFGAHHRYTLPHTPITKRPTENAVHLAPQTNLSVPHDKTVSEKTWETGKPLLTTSLRINALCNTSKSSAPSSSFQKKKTLATVFFQLILQL